MALEIYILVAIELIPASYQNMKRVLLVSLKEIHPNWIITGIKSNAFEVVRVHAR
jgi:hypothetical protein